MPPRAVIIDTNFLFLPYQFKINIMKDLDYLLDFSHYYAISSQTIAELETLGATSGKAGAAARVALKVLQANRHRIRVIEDDRHVDDWIVEHAREKRAIVCTNDRKLRTRLKADNIKIITMKSKSRLGYV